MTSQLPKDTQMNRENCIPKLVLSLKFKIKLAVK